MNKADLIGNIQETMGGTKSAAEEVFSKLFETITGALKKGDKISIPGFGVFLVKDKAAREARNPKTGATVHVPATRVPKFRPSKELKETVKK